MNREHAKAILANLDLIRHFANGGDIGHRLINCAGKFLYTSPTKKIVLSNLHNGPDKYYVRVKSALRFDPDIGSYVRRDRCFTERIAEHEIICGKEDKYD